MFLETQAIGWSYAACVYLEIDPGLFFMKALQGKIEGYVQFQLGYLLGVKWIRRTWHDFY